MGKDLDQEFVALAGAEEGHLEAACLHVGHANTHTNIRWPGIWAPAWRGSENEITSNLVEQLQELATRLSPGRPAAVVRVRNGRRLVEGWRLPEIRETLDACVKINGDLHAPIQAFEVDSAEYKRAWARNNQAKARANSRVQWQKAEVAMRAEYSECCTLYASIYPGAPVAGFDTWRRQFRKLWRDDRLDCLARMHAWKVDAEAGLRVSITVNNPDATISASAAGAEVGVSGA